MRHLTFDQIFQLPQFKLESSGLLLPPSPGLYFVLEHSPKKQIVYIGKANNLQQRWKTHHRMKDLLLLEAIGAELAIAFTPGVRCYSDDLLYADEMFFIETFNPPLNNYKTPIKSKKVQSVERSSIADLCEEEFSTNKIAHKELIDPSKLDLYGIPNLDLSGLYRASERIGWVDASFAKSYCSDLNSFAKAQVEDIFKLLVSNGKGAIKIKSYNRSKSDSRLVWISEPLDQLDLDLITTKLKERGNKFGYLTLNRLKSYVGELRRYDAEEVKALFESLCSRGVMDKRLVRGKEQFCYFDTIKTYPKLLRKQKEFHLITG